MKWRPPWNKMFTLPIPVEGSSYIRQHGSALRILICILYKSELVGIVSKLIQYSLYYILGGVVGECSTGTLEIDPRGGTNVFINVCKYLFGD